jgi:hypothetical protein
LKDKQKTERRKKNLPFGRWEDFEACVLDMKDQGHSLESANKICGAIKARVEKGEIFKMKRIVSGIRPTGDLHLGHYLGKLARDLLHHLKGGPQLGEGRSNLPQRFHPDYELLEEEGTIAYGLEDLLDLAQFIGKDLRPLGILLLQGRDLVLLAERPFQFEFLGSIHHLLMKLLDPFLDDLRGEVFGFFFGYGRNRHIIGLIDRAENIINVF